jgi:chromosome segregation ATPase
MPETAMVEKVNDKLREFDAQVDGAIVAAKTLTRIKADAEKLLTEIQDTSNKSEQALQKVEAVGLQLQQLQRQWETLKQQVQNEQFKEVRELVLSELSAAVDSLKSKVEETGDRLNVINGASLVEHGELLKRLDTSTKANADVAAKAQSIVVETATRLDELLATVREQLQSEVRTKLADGEVLLESELERMHKFVEKEHATLGQSVDQQVANHQRMVREEMDAFQAEMKRNLSDHQQRTDRQLSDFLAKQNALVQNLSQRVDSINQACHTQSEELAATDLKLTELASAFGAHKTSVESELTALAAGLTELKSLVTRLQDGLHSNEERISSLKSALKNTAVRFEETLERLQQLPVIGRKFT